ncbi:hypothetical protein M2347_000617 [Chryseobacterium sp. H1D6B]|nr:hypothetical protein [Chryseobacterium sp. H1D6B]
MKKLSRSKLKNIKGSMDCSGCPIGNTYGPGPEYSNTCDQYEALAPRCRSCVDVAYDCQNPPFLK